MLAEDVQKIKQEILKEPCYLLDPIMIKWMNAYAKDFPSGSIFVELGTFMGGTTRQLSKINPNAIIPTIDVNDIDLWKRWNYNGLRKFLKRCQVDPKSVDLLELQNLHLEDCPNVIRHTGDSLNLDLTDISFILVDSLHTTEHILKELDYYWPRIKSGGILFADDLGVPPVKDAFKQFSESNNLRMQVLWNRYAMIQKI